MNTITSSKISPLLALALTLGGLHSARAADEPGKMDPATVDRVVEALNSSGLSQDAVAQIRKSIEQENPAGGTTSIVRKVIVVGPDGKVQGSESGGLSQDALKKIVSESRSSGGAPVVKVNGQAVIIGPDGQKKEIRLGDDAAGFNAAIKEALKDAKVDPGSLDFLSVGPGVIVSPDQDKKGLEEKVDRLQSDVAEIRDALKKIEEKLK